MKNLFMLFALMVVIVMASCEKVPILPEESAVLSIEGTGLKALTTPGNDTLFVEQGAVVVLDAVSSGPTMVTWSWTFSDGGTANEKTVTHKYTIEPLAVASISLTTTDAAGTTYNKTKIIKAVYSLDGLGAIVIISNTKVGDVYNLVMACNKNGMRYNSNHYFYTGTVNNWAQSDIAPADTNWLIVNGALVAPETGDVGKYVVVRLNGLTPRKNQMGVGKIVGSESWWGTFWGPYIVNKTMITWTLNTDGTITPGDGSVDPLLLPGKVGDNIRAEITSDSKLVIYTNNENNFSNITPFLKIQNENGTWQAPIAESSVTGFQKWGKVEIPLTQLNGGKLTFRFGTNISQPTVYSGTQKASMFWDSYFKVLKLICHQVKSANLLGESQQQWVIVSGADNGSTE